VLLKHKEKMKLMGNEGFEYVNKNFLWGKIAKDFIKILESKKII